MLNAPTEPMPLPNHGGPHVVLLGAGASRAAFPNGDKWGRRLPLMCDIVEVCGLQPILRGFGIPYDGENMEALYSRLLADPATADCVASIEATIFRYFESLELPDEPTLYDHLVLSLRAKDMIVTFNWDPLLWQALARVSEYATTPLPVFLHGNVSVGYCRHHKPVIVGPRSNRCERCGQLLEDSRLLYPVMQKGYSSDALLADAWSEVQRHLRKAFVLTIFGYSAPDTDGEAKELLREGWGDVEKRFTEQVEIIDIKPIDELKCTWRPLRAPNKTS